MKMSFTKKPTNPITTKPIAVRTATLENSKVQNASEKSGSSAHRFESNWKGRSRIGIRVSPLRSGLWQRFTSLTLSLANSLSGSKTESMASILSQTLDTRMQICVDLFSFSSEKFYFIWRQVVYLSKNMPYFFFRIVILKIIYR